MKKILITSIVIITLAACISPQVEHKIPDPEEPITKESPPLKQNRPKKAHPNQSPYPARPFFELIQVGIRA